MKIIKVMIKLWKIIVIPLLIGVIFGIIQSRAEGVLVGTMLGSSLAAFSALFILKDEDYRKAEQEVEETIHQKVEQPIHRKTLGEKSLVVKIAYGRPWVFVVFRDLFHLKKTFEPTDMRIALWTLGLLVSWGAVCWIVQLLFISIAFMIVLMVIIILQITALFDGQTFMHNDDAKFFRPVRNWPKIRDWRVRPWVILILCALTWYIASNPQIITNNSRIILITSVVLTFRILYRWNREPIRNYIQKNKHRMYINVKL